MPCPNVVSLVEPPFSRAPVELAEVKAHMGIEDSGQDAVLSAWIAAVSEAFAGSHGLDRDFWFATYQEQLPGRGTRELFLARHPVVNVVEVSERGAAMDPAAFQVSGSDRDLLRRSNGNWLESTVDESIYSDGTESLDYTVEHRAGYLMPGAVSDWSPDTAYSEGSWVRSTSRSVFLFEATTGGQTGSQEPPWPGEGEAVIDGTVTWTAFRAEELPAQIRLAALLQVEACYRGDWDIPVGVQRQTDSEGSETFFERLASHLSPPVRALLSTYR